MAVLGIDIGTSSCKTVLTDLEGSILAQASSPYPLSTPQSLWSEQNPEDWWQGLILSVRQVLSDYPTRDIRGIGLSGQMHGLVMVNKKNQVLRPAILWNDGRAQQEAEILYKHIPNYLEEAGNVPLAGQPAPKILWVQRNEPLLWKEVAKLCLPKDYLRFCLTDQWVTDMSDGAGTLLMKVEHRCWNQTLLNVCKVSEGMLPTLIEGSEISGYLSQKAATCLGLNPGIPVVGGAGDQVAAAIGMGCITPERTMISLGTSGVVFTTTQHYQANRQKAINNFCHALPNTWFHMGVMLSAAGSLQWYRDTCAMDLQFDELCNSIKEIPMGALDLIFLPYLTGERTPHCDPYVRGAFIGLSRRHTQAHLTRAVLEGIGFGLYESILLMQAGGIHISEAIMTGMGTKSEVWMQLLADIFNLPLIQAKGSEIGPALGAARLAILGCTSAKVEEICTPAETLKRFRPNPTSAIVYRTIMQKFQTLYPLLKDYYSSPFHHPDLQENTQKIAPISLNNQTHNKPIKKILFSTS